MRYALSNLIDGQPPAWRAIDGDALPGEVVVERPPAEGLVWDAATESLRERSASERVEIVREAKRAYIRAEVNRRASEVMPIWEFVYLVNQGISDPRMSDLQDIARRGRELETYIDDPARTVEEIEAVVW